MSAALAVQGARRASKLSRKQLSQLSGVAESSVSLLEAGRTSPNVATVERLLAATRHQLVAIPTRRSDAASAAAGIAQSLATGRRDDAVRYFIQLADDLAAEHDEIRYALTIAAPSPSGEKRWDSALAALVQHRLTEEKLPVPSWTRKPGYRLSRTWTFGSGSYDIPVERSRVPPAFLEHGVLIDPDLLTSA